MVEHDDGSQSIDAHLDAPTVSVGDVVLRGDEVGLSGGTGSSGSGGGPQLKRRRARGCNQRCRGSKEHIARSNEAAARCRRLGIDETSVCKEGAGLLGVVVRDRVRCVRCWCVRTSIDVAHDPGAARCFATAFEVTMTNSAETDPYDNLGCTMLVGQGRPVDRPNAAALFEQSAGMGSVIGLYNVSVCYAYGFGRRRDQRLAVALERQAAQAGLHDAMVALGFRHLNGLGLKKDLRTALLWYRRASRLGNSSAHFSLGQVYRDMGKTKLAFKYFSLGANAGHAKCEFILGLMHVKGEGVRPNRERGLELIEEARAHGNGWARQWLQQERGSSKNPKARAVTTRTR